MLNAVMKRYEFWFVVGSQHLYGPEVLEQVAEHAQVMDRRGTGRFLL